MADSQNWSKAARKVNVDPLLVLLLAATVLLSQADLLNSFLASQLCELTGIKAASAGSQDTLLVAFLNAGLALVYALGGFLCTRYLAGTARVIVIPQLLALTAMLILPFYKVLVPYLEPVSYLAAGVFGYAFGVMGSRLGDASQRAYTQQVEATLRNRELLETRLQLIKQDEIERKMLAADLHDQVLNDMKFLLKLVQEDKTLGQTLFSDLNSRIELAMDNVRKVMESLCPSDLEHIGLLAALEQCLKDRAEKNGFIPQFRSSIKENQLEMLSRIDKALLYRLVQESITNICKHANATRVRLSADISDGEFVIKILDDGVGLKAGKINDKSRGLQYMRLRSEIIGARISWDSGPEDKGTLVEIKVHLKGRASSENSNS